MQWCHWWHYKHCVTPMGPHYWKIHVTPHFSCLNLRNTVVLSMMLLAACDTDTYASDIKLLESHVEPYFYCLELRKAMVQLTPPLALHDVRAGDNGVTRQKNLLNLILLYLDLRNSVVLLMVLSTSHDSDTNAVASCDVSVDENGITRKKWCCPLFQLS